MGASSLHAHGRMSRGAEQKRAPQLPVFALLLEGKLPSGLFTPRETPSRPLQVIAAAGDISLL